MSWSSISRSIKKTFTIQMEMQLERCNEDLTQCTTYPSMVRDNVCNEFNTTFYGKEFLSRVHPPLKCPIKTVSFDLVSFFLGKIHFQQQPRRFFEFGQIELHNREIQDKNTRVSNQKWKTATNSMLERYHSDCIL